MGDPPAMGIAGGPGARRDFVLQGALPLPRRGKPAPWLLRSALGHQSLGGVKERGLGREKFGWDVVSRKAGADSQGEPGAWMAWQNCPRGEQGVFVCHHSTIHWV